MYLADEGEAEAGAPAAAALVLVEGTEEEEGAVVLRVGEADEFVDAVVRNGDGERDRDTEAEADGRRDGCGR